MFLLLIFILLFFCGRGNKFYFFLFISFLILNNFLEFF
ncbi:hypothetical protein LEP1GSC083_0073 [Leptospira interrogans serovar Pyrogenes str. L0374]|uniref:Uncharacterized protein n=1 Tax=Leptospira interrogans serovar Pyrogenes str. L0374 TaxID=1049928 RepID=M6K828_LEPIR|nr:hypothetical protein LEP1GSC083_0073 [Leptospira interrogans serovar Pyrogenes str. L0374]